MLSYVHAAQNINSWRAQNIIYLILQNSYDVWQIFVPLPAVWGHPHPHLVLAGRAVGQVPGEVALEKPLIVAYLRCYRYAGHVQQKGVLHRRAGAIYIR